MNKNTVEYLSKQFNIDTRVIEFINSKEIEVNKRFNDLNNIKEYNQLKVLNAMQKARLDSTHFNWTTGYGYDDVGRDKIEEIYSNIFNTEDALVRPTIVSGTHAISLSLFGLLRPNDEMLCITGTPYDTLQKVIGIVENNNGTLMEYGIKYSEISLIDNKFDNKKIMSSIKSNTKLVYIQRSTGYSNRNAINIDQIDHIIKEIKAKHKDIIVMVDNCYGEFVEMLEPSDVGADVIAGSLIKNPGGGLALTGGYIAGKKSLINLIANRSTAPGIGKECGLTFGTTRRNLQGLFMAPIIVMEALKGALLAAKIFTDLGYNVIPSISDKRSDIVQAIEFKSEELVINFCQGIQSASPVDSYVTPQPWKMPGYEDEVIMAAGAFVQGSSIELSADAPIREPYIAYLQGGLSYIHCKTGLMVALNKMYKNSLIKLDNI